MELGFAGKRVLVTGGSKGIGLACANAFAGAGASVILVARDAGRLASAAADLRAKHQVGVVTHAGDLADPDERAKLAAAHPDIDVLVNNAGAIPGGDIFDIDITRWIDAWRLKVFGYIDLTGRYLASMKEKRAGTIINIIGMAGRRPTFDYICGGAANASLIAFTEAIGGGSPAFGVRVFGINPTQTRTDRIVTLSKTKAKAQFGDESRWQEVLKNLPFDRLMEPDEVANLALFCASPRVGYLSGTVIDMDGGVSNR